eukprot:3846950-Rhodomonas_salina.1
MGPSGWLNHDTPQVHDSVDPLHRPAPLMLMQMLDKAHDRFMDHGQGQQRRDGLQPHLQRVRHQLQGLGRGAVPVGLTANNCPELESLLKEPSAQVAPLNTPWLLSVLTLTFCLQLRKLQSLVKLQRWGELRSASYAGASHCGPSYDTSRVRSTVTSTIKTAPEMSGACKLQQL